MTLEAHVDRILASWSRLGSVGEFLVCYGFEAITILTITHSRLKTLLKTSGRAREKRRKEE